MSLSFMRSSSKSLEMKLRTINGPGQQDGQTKTTHLPDGNPIQKSSPHMRAKVPLLILRHAIRVLFICMKNCTVA